MGTTFKAKADRAARIMDTLRGYHFPVEDEDIQVLATFPSAGGGREGYKTYVRFLTADKVGIEFYIAQPSLDAARALAVEIAWLFNLAT